MTVSSMKDLMIVLKSKFEGIRWKIDLTLFKEDSPIERIKSDLIINADTNTNELCFMGTYNCNDSKWVSFIEWCLPSEVPKGEYPSLIFITSDKSGTREELFGTYLADENKFVTIEKTENNVPIYKQVDNVKYWAYSMDKYSIGTK